MDAKIDFKRTLDSYLAKSNEYRIVEVPEMQYLMVDGFGDPNTSMEFTAGIEALYPVAYKLKFASKNSLDKDYVVPPLEALWWAEDMNLFTSQRDKSNWSWTLMLMVPDWVENTMFEQVVEKLKQGSAGPDALERVRLERYSEGQCVQTLHLGSFDDEGPTLQKMHDDFLPRNGLKPVLKHHEIYFSDFRKVSPDKLRTILRQPVMEDATN